MEPGIENPEVDRRDVQFRWKAAFGMQPPKHLSTGFMLRALGWEVQAKASGRLSASARRTLLAIGKAGSVAAPPSCQIRAGTHLVREWNGRTYQVEVLDKSFYMDGRAYRSLSAIAKQITGTNWSGPRFFGLTGAGS